LKKNTKQRHIVFIEAPFVLINFTEKYPSVNIKNTDMFFCRVAISTECAEHSYFYLIWHAAACVNSQSAFAPRAPHNIHMCAQKQMAAFVLWLADTHFTLSAAARHTPAVSIFQYAQGAPLSIIRASLALGWGWCDTSSFLLPRAQEMT
jgi:hypothetical protein